MLQLRFYIGLNLAVDAVRGKDLVEEIDGEQEEFRDGDVKSNNNSVKSSKPHKLSRSKKLKMGIYPCISGG